MIELGPKQQESWPASLLHLLERQQSMVSELVQLASSQAALIAEHRTDGLLDVLARRQTLIDEFTSSQAQMAQLTFRLDERLSNVDHTDQSRIRFLIAAIGESLAQVMKTDASDQHSLRRSRDQVKRDLGDLGAAKQARSAYVGSHASNTRYADRHG